MSCNTEVITIQANGTPDRDKAKLDNELDQELIWVSEADDDYEIRFDNGRSPFNQPSYVVHAKGWVAPGKIKLAKGHDEKTYTYNTYKVGSNVAAADPDVIIKNAG